MPEPFHIAMHGALSGDDSALDPWLRGGEAGRRAGAAEDEEHRHERERETREDLRGPRAGAQGRVPSASRAQRKPLITR